MLDDELRALVSVDAPPGFQARVQATIAARQAPTAWQRVRRPWFVPVAAATALVIAAWLNAPTEPAEEVEMLGARATAGVAPLRPRIGSQPPAVQVAGLRLNTTAPPEIALNEPPRPVLIDKAEALALQQLFAQAAALPLMDLPEAAGDVLVFPEITITPLVIETVSDSEGGRQ